jgi:hypothetical protein
MADAANGTPVTLYVATVFLTVVGTVDDTRTIPAALDTPFKHLPFPHSLSRLSRDLRVIPMALFRMNTPC